MLISANTIQSDCDISADIVIVGAGPAGIVLALELEKSGLDILLIESGNLQISEAAQSLGEASTLRRRSIDYSSRRHRAFSKHDDSRSTSASEY